MVATASKMISRISILVLLAVSTAFSAPAEFAHEKVRKLAVANNNLALNLHQILSGSTTENVFFSPFSLSTAFGMLFYGAKGDTAEELRRVLGYEKARLPSEDVHSSFNQFLTSYIPSRDTGFSEYTLDVANSVLVDKNLDLFLTYKRNVQSFYHASVKDVDFLNDGPTIVNEVNQWVKTKTHGKIDHLVDELSPSTVMVLLNAVYFKGTWKTEFEPERTLPQKFYNHGLESSAKEVPLMHIEAKYPYTEVDDFQVLELPYKGENISMFVFLPKQRDGLYALERSLTLEKISSFRQRLYPRDVFVSLPKFKIEYFHELSSEFQTLGANKIFNAGAADFSGMTSSKDVYVSEVLHKAVIEVNEEGSEAAAVTGIISNRMGRLDDVEFNADHPFLFSIVDKRSDMALFVGRVNSL